MNQVITGYAHPAYALSLAEYGTPFELPRSGGWLLKRSIPGSEYSDAMGCYPLFACRDWAALKADIEDLDRDLVSVSLVPDPFGSYTISGLNDCFPDKCVRFKEHQVLELHREVNPVFKKRTRQSITAALRAFRVERCPNPLEQLDEWMRLYNETIRKHRVTGIQALSRASFAAQMQVPGFHLFRAIGDEGNEGMVSWFQQGNVAYAHLLGVNGAGYLLGAVYAMLWSSILYFRDKVNSLDFGGPAGASNDDRDGLAAFKRKWASGTRAAYFCGRIVNHQRYEELISRRRIATGYFPAYRAGELIRGTEE